MFELAIIIENPFFYLLLVSSAVFGVLFLFINRKEDDLEIFNAEHLTKSPILVFRNGVFIKENLFKIGLSESDLIDKIYNSEILSLDEINGIIVNENQEVIVFPKSNKLNNFILSGKTVAI